MSNQPTYSAMLIQPDIRGDLTKETITEKDVDKMKSAILKAHALLTQKNGKSPTTIAITGGWWLQLHSFLTGEGSSGTKLFLTFNKYAPQSWGKWFSPAFTIGYMDRTDGEPKPEGEIMASVPEVPEEQPVSEIMALVQQAMTPQDTVEPPESLSVMDLVAQVADGTGGVVSTDEIESMLNLTLFDPDGEEVDVDFPLSSNGAITMQKETSILYVWPMFDETGEEDDDDKIGVMFVDQPNLVYIFTANLVSIFDYTLGEFAGKLNEFIEEELSEEGQRKSVAYPEFISIMQDEYSVDITAS